MVVFIVTPARPVVTAAVVSVALIGRMIIIRIGSAVSAAAKAEEHHRKPGPSNAMLDQGPKRNHLETKGACGLILS